MLGLWHCREIAGANGTRLPSFPVAWSMVDCGAYFANDIFMHVVPGAWVLQQVLQQQPWLRASLDCAGGGAAGSSALRCHTLPPALVKGGKRHPCAAVGGPAGNDWWQGVTFNNAKQTITNVTINGNNLSFSTDNQ